MGPWGPWLKGPLGPNVVWVISWRLLSWFSRFERHMKARWPYMLTSLSFPLRGPRGFKRASEHWADFRDNDISRLYERPWASDRCWLNILIKWYRNLLSLLSLFCPYIIKWTITSRICYTLWYEIDVIVPSSLICLWCCRLNFWVLSWRRQDIIITFFI